MRKEYQPISEVIFSSTLHPGPSPRAETCYAAHSSMRACADLIDADFITPQSLPLLFGTHGDICYQNHISGGPGAFFTTGKSVLPRAVAIHQPNLKELKCAFATSDSLLLNERTMPHLHLSQAQLMALRAEWRELCSERLRQPQLKDE